MIWSLVIYENHLTAITGCFPTIVDGWFRVLVFRSSSPKTAMTALNQVRLLFFNPLNVRQQQQHTAAAITIFLTAHTLP